MKSRSALTSYWAKATWTAADNQVSRLHAKAMRTAISASRKCRPVVSRLMRAVFVTLRVTAEIVLWLLMTLSRTAGWALRRLVRWTLHHPRPAAYAAGVIAVAVLALVFLAPTPPSGFGDFDESLACMAQNIYHEARGEPMVAQIAVAKVVMNRVGNRHFPGTVCAVIKQGGEWPYHACQFSWWCDGRTDAILDQRAMSKTHTLARDVLLGYHDDPTDGAMWYHAKSVAPDWRRDFAEGPTIGSHIFYRPR